MITEEGLEKTHTFALIREISQNGCSIKSFDQVASLVSATHKCMKSDSIHTRTTAIIALSVFFTNPAQDGSVFNISNKAILNMQDEGVFRTLKNMLGDASLLEKRLLLDLLHKISDVNVGRDLLYDAGFVNPIVNIMEEKTSKLFFKCVHIFANISSRFHVPDPEGKISKLLVENIDTGACIAALYFLTKEYKNNKNALKAVEGCLPLFIDQIRMSFESVSVNEKYLFTISYSVAIMCNALECGSKITFSTLYNNTDIVCKLTRLTCPNNFERNNDWIRDWSAFTQINAIYLLSNFCNMITVKMHICDLSDNFSDDEDDVGGNGLDIVVYDKMMSQAINLMYDFDASSDVVKGILDWIVTLTSLRLPIDDLLLECLVVSSIQYDHCFETINEIVLLFRFFLQAKDVETPSIIFEAVDSKTKHTSSHDSVSNKMKKARKTFSLTAIKNAMTMAQSIPSLEVYAKKYDVPHKFTETISKIKFLVCAFEAESEAKEAMNKKRAEDEANKNMKELLHSLKSDNNGKRKKKKKSAPLPPPKNHRDLSDFAAMQNLLEEARRESAPKSLKEVNAMNLLQEIMRQNSI